MSKKLRDIISETSQDQKIFDKTYKFKEFLKEEDEYLYHGTKAHLIDFIKKSGLSAPINHFHKNWHYAKQWEHGALLRIHQRNLPADHKRDSTGHVYTKKNVKPKFLEIHKEGKWKRLLDESKKVMVEMPVLDYGGGFTYMDDPTNRNHPEKSTHFKKIGNYQGYHVLRNLTQSGNRGYYLYDPHSKEFHLQLKGYPGKSGRNHTIEITWLQKHSKSHVKASDFMHYLITRHNVEIHSDTTQTPKATKAWFNLSKKPDIEIHSQDNEKKYESTPIKPHHNNYQNFLRNYQTSSERLIAKKKKL